MIAPAMAELRSWVHENMKKCDPPTLPFFSALLGKLHPRHKALPESYWVSSLSFDGIHD